MQEPFNPYAPPRAPQDAFGAPTGATSDLARGVQAALLVVVFLLHAFFFAGAVLMTNKGEGPGPLLRELQNGVGSHAREVGALTAMLAMLVYGPISMSWAAVNLVALIAKRRWTRTSLRAYWILNIVVCGCAPFGIVGLLHIAASKAPFGGPT